MLKAANPVNPPMRSVRFPGICSDAIVLGVNRCTLYAALTGMTKQYTLVQRYQALKKRQIAQARQQNSRSLQRNKNHALET